MAIFFLNLQKIKNIKKYFYSINYYNYIHKN